MSARPLRCLSAASFLLIATSIQADDSVSVQRDIPYYPESIRSADDYIDSRARLDVYCPDSEMPQPVIVWFHAGGIRGGEKHLPDALVDKGVCVVSPNYRLFPKVLSPAYIEDAAAAVAWVFDSIADYGGDPSLIFLSGHSAGGYLSSMLTMDKRWLEAHDIDANVVAGLIPMSGHTITHFTIREERGLPGETPVIDDLAPIYHVREDAPPILLITGDREKELLGRYEENAYFMRMMTVAGHVDTRIIELKGYGHSMTEPAFPLLLDEVERVAGLRRAASAAGE
ncbi:MAG: alpha/beta hydrolase [Woeseiaceae bacterium]|nr:alpha/beta hydrolase [Woeseiaceae bacterium]